MQEQKNKNGESERPNPAITPRLALRKNTNRQDHRNISSNTGPRDRGNAKEIDIPRQSGTKSGEAKAKAKKYRQTERRDSKVD